MNMSSTPPIDHPGLDGQRTDLQRRRGQGASACPPSAVLAEARARAGATDCGLSSSPSPPRNPGCSARHYAANLIIPLAQTAGGVATWTSVSRTGVEQDIVLIGAGKSELDAYLKRAPPPRAVRSEPTPENGFYYRSDHFSRQAWRADDLLSKGGEDLRQWRHGGGRGGLHHQPLSCKSTKNMIPRAGGAGLTLSSTTMIGRALATSHKWPNWFPTPSARSANNASGSRAGSTVIARPTRRQPPEWALHDRVDRLSRATDRLWNEDPARRRRRSHSCRVRAKGRGCPMAAADRWRQRTRCGQGRCAMATSVTQACDIWRDTGPRSW